MHLERAQILYGDQVNHRGFFLKKKTVETLFKCPAVKIIPKQSHFTLIKCISQQQFLLTKKFLLPLTSFLFLYLLDQTLFLLITDG